MLQCFSTQSISVHAEECNFVSKIDTKTYLVTASQDSTRRSHDIHFEIKCLFHRCIRSIPGASIAIKEPVIEQHYLDVGPIEKEKNKKKNPVTSPTPPPPPSTPISAIGEISLPVLGCISDAVVGEVEVVGSPIPVKKSNSFIDRLKRGDLEIHYTDKTGSIAKKLVDVTCYSIHKKSNHTHARVTSGVANHGQSVKDKAYERFEHLGEVIGFAVDSAGGLSDAARKFVNDLFAKPDSVECSAWLTDKDRVTHKKRFIDSLSCLLARHRALDLRRMGTRIHSKNRLGRSVVATEGISLLEGC